VRVDGNAIRFGVSGTAATYAPTHQFGARTGRNRAVFVPARPFLPLDATGGLRFDSGRARAWLDRTKRNIARYILTGKA
jgi:phage gpG-like protein